MTEKYGYKEYTQKTNDIPEEAIKSYFDDKKSWEDRYLSPIIRTKDWDLITDELGKEGHTNIFQTHFFTEAFGEDVITLAEKSNCWTQKRHEKRRGLNLLSSMYRKMNEHSCIG